MLNLKFHVGSFQILTNISIVPYIVTKCLKAEQGSHFLGNEQKRFHCND
jgi:hypothetical protein